jgi:ABC-type Fe3+ transport system substrate-binding protein
MTIRLPSRLINVFLPLCLLASVNGARAATPADVEKIATYQGSDRASFLEQGARHEGQLTIYTVGAQIDPLLAAFHKKYPFVAVQTYKADTPDITRRVLDEYGAGVTTVDAFELNDYGLAPLRDAGALATFWSPELKNYPPDAIEPNRHWVVMREDVISLGFNTKVIDPSRAPKTNADLLSPAWRGRLGLYGGEAALATWVGTLLLSEGEDFLRKVVAQKPTVYNMGGRAVANLIVSGEAPLVINARRSHIFASARDGAPVAWRAIGPSFTSVSAVAIAARAPHPYAATLFTDFMLSEQAQKIYRYDLGYTSRRNGLAMPDDPKDKLYLGSRPYFQRDFENWAQLATQLLSNGP